MGSRVAVRTALAVGGLAVLATPVLLLVAGVHDPGDLADGLLLVPAFYAAGVVASRSRPGRRGPLLLLAAGALLALSHALATLPAVAGSGGGGLWLVNLASRVCDTTGFAAWAALYGLVPGGAFRSVRQRRAVLCWLVFAAAVPVLGFFGRPVQPLIYVVPQPATPVPVWTGALAPLDTLAGFFWLAPIAALVVLARTARRLPPEERARLRWVLWSAVVVALALASSPLLVSAVGGTAQSVVFVLATATLPVALGIAMVRDRLFDVDLVLRRSFVYGVLGVGVLAAGAGLAALLTSAAGRRYDVPLAVGCTVVAAIAFEPARRGLARLADRWFLGERPGRYELVRGFGTALDRTRDPDELARQIAGTVRQGLDAEWAEVALDGAGGGRAAALAVPLDAGGDGPGQIRCGPRRGGGGYDDADRELLAVLSRQAGLALRDARLTHDLAQRVRELEDSRGRIVQAEEAERRRIERDLHDGIQQELVALMAKVELARAQLERSPAAAAQALEDLRALVRQTHGDLRTLVAGIHPAVLGDRGLAEAVATRSRQLPVPVEVDSAIDSVRFDPGIEGAAYFLVSEALTNVVRHAGATCARVVLDRDGGGLRVEVTDDGTGFPVETATGSGLRGLRDRLEALGGSLEVRSRPGAGTCVVGRLPVRERVGG